MAAIRKRTQNEVKTTQEDLSMKYLSFLVADEIYAVSIMRVKEILEYGNITPLPRMPDFLWGAINLRGRVVPVIDLAVRLDKAVRSDVTRRTCIIIVEMLMADQSRMNVGLVVDAVSKVLDIHADQIESVPSFGGNINTDFIEGMGKLETGFVILLNIDSVLSMKDQEMLQQMGGNKPKSETTTPA